MRKMGYGRSGRIAGAKVWGAARVVVEGLEGRLLLCDWQEYAVGTGPVKVASGDFDGDGRVDLVTANTQSQDLSVLLNNGDGTFATATECSAGGRPLDVLVADVNEDGKLDLVTSGVVVRDEGTDGFLGVLIGAGNGSFAEVALTELGIGKYAGALAAGDFDGDGHLDVVGVGNGTLGYWRGNGAGGFAATAEIGAGSWGVCIASADFNGDHRSDLAVGGGAGVEILLGSGTGEFGDAASVTSVAAGAITVGDLNGDGEPDLVVTEPSVARVEVLKGNGDGTFVSVCDAQTNPGPMASAITDFDGDGNLDVVSTCGSLAILYGDGTGVVAPYITTSGSVYSFYVGSGPCGVIVADFNGDGVDDEAIADSGSNSVGIMRNDFPPRVTIETPVSGQAGTIHVRYWLADEDSDLTDINVQVSFDVGLDWYTLSPGEVGGEGTTGLASSPSGMEHELDWYRGTAQGGPFSVRLRIVPAGSKGRTGTTSDFVIGPNQSPTAENFELRVGQGNSLTFNRAWFDAAFSDPDASDQLQWIQLSGIPLHGTLTVNGQVVDYGWVNNYPRIRASDLDHMVYTPAANYVGNDWLGWEAGDGTAFSSIYSTVAIGVQGANPIFAPELDSIIGITSPVITGDFTGDGRLDVLEAGSGMWIGNGDGTFGRGIISNLPASLEMAATADFNRDGKCDVVSCGPDISVLLSNGDGTFSKTYRRLSAGGVSAVVCGDFDNDGKEDVLWEVQAWIYVLKGNGDGTFVPLPGLAIGYVNTHVGLVTGDFNNDGNLDLADELQTGYTVRVLLGNGRGGFAQPMEYDRGYYGGLHGGDFDHDGALDLLLTNSTAIEVLHGDGQGSFSKTTLSPAEANMTWVACADLNGDGAVDVVGGWMDQTSLYIMFGRGDGNFVQGPEYGLGRFGWSQLHQFVVGDIGGDGLPDLLLVNDYDASTLVVFRNVSNGNEPPALDTPQASVAENISADSVVAELSGSDPNPGDALRYVLVPGTGSGGNGLFWIEGNQLKTKASFDYETKKYYNVRVRVIDGGGLWSEQTFRVDVGDVNEAPAAVALTRNSVVENQPAGAVVGTLTGSDPDAGDVLTYSLTTGTGALDNAQFQIVGNELRTAAVFEHASKDAYSIRVKVTDAAGLSYKQVFTVYVSAEEKWVSLVPVAGVTQIHVNTAAEVSSASVAFTFGSSGFRVTDWGTPVVAGNVITVEPVVEHWTGTAGAVMTTLSHTYGLGALGAGAYVLRVVSGGQPVMARAFAVGGAMVWNISGSDGADAITVSVAGAEYTPASELTLPGVDVGSAGTALADYMLELNGQITRCRISDVSQIRIEGGEGDEVVTVGAGVAGVRVFGGEGNDTITGGDGSDWLDGEGGADVIRGGNGNDTIAGGPGNDSLYGDGGDDAVHGGKDNDLLRGGNGDDLMYGDKGNDALYGDKGVQYLDGGPGVDVIYARNGLRDSVVGGAGVMDRAQVDEDLDAVLFGDVETLLG